MTSSQSSCGARKYENDKCAVVSEKQVRSRLKLITTYTNVKNDICTLKTAVFVLKQFRTSAA